MKFGLHYLIILVMLFTGCKNMNTEIYIDFIRQFDESIIILQKENSFIYDQFNQANFVNPARTKKWLVNVNKIKEQRVKLTDFIDSLQNNLDTLNSKEFIQNSHLDQGWFNKRVRLNKADIKIIENRITKYNTSIKSFVYNHKKYESIIKDLNSSLNIDSLNLISVFKGNSVSLLEAMACIMKLKSEIVIAESIFLHYSFSQVDVSCFKFRKIEALVVPNSQILPVGYPYQAEIYLTSIDTTISYAFEIDGQKFETKSGIGTYQFRAKDKPGVYSKNGNFFYKSPVDGEIQNYPFKIEYEVLEK